MSLDRAYRLTHEIVASFGGGPIVCLDARSVGRTYRLHDERPGPLANSAIRADVIGGNGVVIDGVPHGEADPVVTRVDVSGPLEQRAGYHDPCSGWSDGHDAVAERMISALAEGDVLMVFDSPGGAHAGLQEAIRRVVEAKAAHGRRVTGYVDEMCGSAAYWWAACVCDELYAPPSGIVGSIGARSSHASVAGALAIDGIDVTYFAAPGAGKVAFAPELPLSDLGKQRGERDVWEAFEAFAAAVGPARGMTRDEIVELDADALSGDAAVAAKLIDGIASFEDVVEMAATQADASQSPDAETMAPEEAPAAPAAGARMAHAHANAIRSEAEKTDEESPEGASPTGKCAGCGMANDLDAKFCDQCGDSMAAKPKADAAEPAAEPKEETDEPVKADEEETPDAPVEPKKSATPPPPMQRGASLAAIFGLQANASGPAIKSAAIRAQRVYAHAAKLTGRSGEQVLGGLDAMAEDAAASTKMRDELNVIRRAQNSAERVTLLEKLAAAGVHPRGELFVDVVEGDKIVGRRPAKLWGAGPEGKSLAHLRGYVASKIANGSHAPAQRSPYEPDASKVSSASITELDRTIAEKTGNDPARVAASRAALLSTNRTTAGA